MGRRRQSNHDDPPRFHKKGKTWYHVAFLEGKRKWTKLSGVIGVNYLGRSASIILAGERRERFRSLVFGLPPSQSPRAVVKSRTPKGLSTGLSCGQVTCPPRPRL